MGKGLLLLNLEYLNGIINKYGKGNYLYFENDKLVTIQN